MGMKIIHKLYEHHFWANARLWACIEQSSDEQLHQANDYSIGSVFAQLRHMLKWEDYWFRSLEAGERQDRATIINDDDYSTREAVRGLHERNEACIRRVLAQLQDEHLEQALTEHMTRGELLIQMYGHALDHRAQIFAALYAVGAPTAEQTYMFFLRERADLQRL